MGIGIKGNGIDLGHIDSAIRHDFFVRCDIHDLAHDAAAIFPALIGVLGGICSGAAYTFVRMLSGRGVKGPVIVFCFSTFSCLAILPFVLLDYHPMTAMQLCYLLLAGLAASGGQFTVTAAYSNAPAREISIYDYTQIIFATVLSFLFLGEIPDALSFIGYIIICGAGVMMYFYNRRQKA